MDNTSSTIRIESIAEQYEAKLHLYIDFTKKLDVLISDILRQNNINVHSVTSRVKDRGSLVKKVSRPDAEYKDLSEVTDVTGIRITTFFSDDVDRIAEIIEREFQVDQSNSIDKRAILDPDRFGYLSLHHVVSLSEGRCQLIEYHRFGGLKCEIQTRSILQHAWAEIEHDLGYKAASSVPNEIRRKFSRLAGLLELADQEFAAIRKELSEYEETVVGRIQTEPDTVDINQASLESFISHSEVVKQLDESIAKIDEGLVNEAYQKEGAIFNILRLEICGIHSIAELDHALSSNEKLIMAFAKQWLPPKKGRRVFAKGVSITYLAFLLIGATQDAEKIKKFLEVSTFKGGNERLTDMLLETYRSIDTAGH